MDEYVAAQWLFLRLLAFVFFLAFWSLGSQVLGLYGSNGILPIKDIISYVRKIYGRGAFWHFPSFFLIDSSDRTIKLLARLGMVCSGFALIGYYPVFLFAVLWFLYLSFHTAGSEFLSYQWDALLLEAGFIAIFFSMQSPPPFLMILLLWFLLFRFHFASGIVKFLSRCPAWKSFTAMMYHYETQPLPNRVAYYLHQMPSFFHIMSQGLALFIELIVPFFIFFPMPFRLFAFAGFVFLQLLILLSGNYAFFNLLSIVLCIPLLDNHALAFLPSQLTAGTTFSQYSPLDFFLNAIALILLVLNGLQFSFLFFRRGPFHKLLAAVSPFCIVNSYGLFARMTLERYEIVVQGSDDGKEWKDYEFKWKPGNPIVAPFQVAPHQPRLDWQMWFAALSRFRSERWFQIFLFRLLEGSPEVLKLLKANPFPGKPPAYVRALFYQYHFSDLKTKRETGAWWTRELKGLYAPALSLKNF